MRDAIHLEMYMEAYAEDGSARQINRLEQMRMGSQTNVDMQGSRTQGFGSMFPG